MDLDQRKLKVLLKEMENFRGRHTELISVYVPAGFNINKVIEQLSNEKSTAQNIKSKPVRNNVMDALDKILAHLRVYKQTPKNGLAVFSGNIAEHEGVSDIEIWGIEPPEPVSVRLYRCDKQFILEPLADAFREKEVYGLIVVDAGEAAIGLIRGKKVIPLKHMDSIVPGKTKAGGWPANRYARIREGILNDFLKTVGKIAEEKFRQEKDLKGIILGGSGPVKDMFLNGDFLQQDSKNKVIGVVDTSYSGEPGLTEAVQRAEDILSQASIIREKKLLERFFEELRKDSGISVYGFKEVENALNLGAVQTLIVSEEFELVEAHVSCKCGHSDKKIVRRSRINLKCPNCGAEMQAEEKDVLHKIIEKAEQTQTEVEMISGEGLGEQFKEIGGIGGNPRYKIE